MHNNVLDGIMGIVVGDALGVPVEFMSRAELANNAVVGMREYGTHNQPIGTWSDDSSMTLCLIESLMNGLDYSDICRKFLAWAETGYMTAHGEVFDMGRTTLKALRNFAQGVPPTECGKDSEYDNGNGSLMRILPLAFYTKDLKLHERFEIVHNVSRLTHAHMRSMMACGIYVQLAIELLKGYGKTTAYCRMMEVCKDFYQEEKELQTYHRVLHGNIENLPEQEIRSSGYVVDTLEAAIWCFLTTDNYRDCILKAVNLGEDTDTIAAVAGGLAGILYGYDSIPKQWKAVIVERKKLESLCLQFGEACNRI